MKSQKILVTGSSGLIGSEAVECFDRLGHSIVGVDNNLRREFFGPAGDTIWNLERLKRRLMRLKNFALLSLPCSGRSCGFGGTRTSISITLRERGQPQLGSGVVRAGTS